MTSLVSPVPGAGVGSPVTLIWIDARQAVVARWGEGAARLDRVAGDLPPHERSLGHVKHNPLIRQGGGQLQTRLDHRRHEAEHAYIDAVLVHVPDEGYVEVIGPGPMRHHLVSRLLRRERPGAARVVRTQAADQMTDAQVAARLRELAGHPPARRAVSR